MKPLYPVMISHRGIVARGVADLVFLEDGLTVTKLVPATRDIWLRITDSELEEHRGEANLLAFGIGAKRWSVCYVDPFDGEILEFAGATNRVNAEWSLDRFAEVADSRKKKTPPKCAIERADRGNGPCDCRWSRAAI